jgi:phage replication-related protein YjqB (UPF0714/DUF867 family)
VADRYDTFQKLQDCESRGVDYDIRVVRRQSTVAIIAPHGGEIEPGTTPIAEAIADERHNFYSLIGLKKGRPHGDLHIASTNFREPECLNLLSSCDVVVAIHGRKDRDDPKTSWLGGRDTALRDAIAKALEAKHFATRVETGALGGTNPTNICNRGRREKGVQLEIPRTVRDKLQNDAGQLDEFAGAIREAVDSVS